ncbi:MAG TPA: HAMP domain-containing sensor histidine kinase [Kofleriaceae bacterium]
MEARDEFIGALGHELRNSIAPLVLLTDHFEQLKISDPKLEPRVAMLARNLKKLTATIDRLTEVSQLRDGKLELDYEHVDLRDIVDDVARDFADDAGRSGIELRVRYSRPVQGWWDRCRLKQLVGNLISNAIRYGDGSDVEIVATNTPDGALLSVTDQGPGIPADMRDHVFDRFDHRGMPRGNGFGVGLFVVKALSQAMGGSAHLEETAKGARFCITLPRG